MTSFSEVKLSWGDSHYVIPANRVLLALAQVEEVLTLHELQAFQARGTVPMARLAQAYGIVLRFAGCSATDDDIYTEMLINKGFDVGQAIAGLMLMMLPPDVFKVEASSEGNVPKAEGKSSRKRTR